MPEWLVVGLPWLGPLVLLVVIARWIWARFHPAPLMDVDSAQVIQFPLPEGAWEAFNSPVSRVPSHGTDWLGQRFAIDLVGAVPGSGYSDRKDWRTRAWLEPPERFHGFGAPVVTPGAGRVVSTYDGVADRRACRSWIGLAWVLLNGLVLGLIALVVRGPRGTAAVAGNHGVIALDSGGFVALMHLQCGSVAVERGSRVETGELVGRVGNSGNTTQPHLHLQLTGRAHPQPANGRPVAFTGVEGRTDAEWLGEPIWMPRNREFTRAAWDETNGSLARDRP